MDTLMYNGWTKPIDWQERAYAELRQIGHRDGPAQLEQFLTDHKQFIDTNWEAMFKAAKDRNMRAELVDDQYDPEVVLK